MKPWKEIYWSFSDFTITLDKHQNMNGLKIAKNSLWNFIQQWFGKKNVSFASNWNVYLFSFFFLFGFTEQNLSFGIRICLDLQNSEVFYGHLSSVWETATN